MNAGVRPVVVTIAENLANDVDVANSVILEQILRSSERRFCD